jgi:hypothetical protein
MMLNGGKADHRNQKQRTESPKGPVRDLPDFHLRWGEFRCQALAVVEKDSLTAQERETLAWLIKMADRVGERDLLSPAISLGV